jgi:hypothetical protein
VPDSSSDGSTPIHIYTRAEAIADGTLVDLSAWASPREMMGGFTIPVAVTRAVWNLIEAPKRSKTQDTRGRAHDVLWMARLAARAYRGGTDAFVFTARLGRRNVRLAIHIGPGDQGERVATIMLPHES